MAIRRTEYFQLFTPANIWAFMHRNQGDVPASAPPSADVVVVGSSRFALLKRVFLGSVSNEVLRGMEHDVLLVSPASARRARRRELTMGSASIQSAGELVREPNAGPCVQLTPLREH